VSFQLGENSYGKSEVRVVKLTRGPDAHALRDLTADVRLQGGFADVHLSGENHDLPATDTMRNVVYACAAEHDLQSVPAFAAELATRLLGLSPLAEAVAVRLRERPWARLDAHSWQGGAGGTRVHTVTVEADTGAITHRGGIEDLLVLRSAGSAFRGFQRDRYTALPETDDRILATVVMGDWEHLDPPS
jgi:urate oxidase